VQNQVSIKCPELNKPVVEVTTKELLEVVKDSARNR
jgi:hypothetical protein